MRNKKVQSESARVLFHRNKKGSISAVVFVMLSLALMISTLVSFLYVNNKIEVTVSGYESYDSFYAKEDLAKFYIWETGEVVLNETDFSLHPEDFGSMFKEQFVKYNFLDDNLKQLKNIIGNGSFEVKTYPEGFLISLGRWDLADIISPEDSTSLYFYTLIYNPKIKVYVGKGFEGYSHLDTFYDLPDSISNSGVLPA